jgi:hypothetical protein
VTRAQRVLLALWFLGSGACADLELGSAAQRGDGGASDGGGVPADTGDLSSINDAIQGDYFAVLSSPGGPLPIQLTLTVTSADQGSYETKCLDKMACPEFRDAGSGGFDPFGDFWHGFISLLSSSGTYRLLDLEGAGKASGILWYADGPLGLSTTFEASAITVANPAGGEALTFSRKRTFPNRP